METLTFRSRPCRSGTIKIKIPRNLAKKELDMVVVINEVQQEKKKPGKYNFTDLSGKLEWKGDAVCEQRRMRREWR
jgi:hypothetical protein